MPTPSGLELTSQVSEDEPASRALHQRQSMPTPPPPPSSRAQQNNEQRQPGRHRHDREPSQSQRTTQTTQRNDSHTSAGNNDDGDPPVDALVDGTTARAGGVVGGLLTRLPNPIDLWQSRTPVSLLLLPLVFVLYALLALPLHFNLSADEGEWRGRASDVDRLSENLNEVEKDLEVVEDDQDEIRGMVSDIRERLNRMKERRRAREEYSRMRQEREQREREEELRKQQQRQPGVAKDGPIASATMVKALAVATFAGKPSVVDDANKED